ncbi:glycosyltransferase family 2 protein [Candidatus Gottesmanbacteria bacterium]|nr:glycosyltransferase family 2 protein [Candidatus Gottesmanbacteria bacterium]
MADKKPSISIFFPFLNDWGTVGSLVGLAISTVEKLTDDWEVIIVNDGSKKEDREALEMIVESFGGIRGIRGIRRIRVIHHKKNRGYGGALRSGFAAAKKDLIFYTDCDAQYDPRELAKLYKSLKPGIAMVNGYKIKRQDPIIRIAAGRLYHYLVKFSFGLPIRDTDCDFRLVRREVFDPSPPAGGSVFESTGTICTELVKKIDHFGYKIVEVPVHHYWRTSGKSQFFNFGRLFATGINLAKLWWKLMVRKDYICST